MIKIKCPCGKIVTATPNQANRKKYCCKSHFYKFRKRPSGLKYKIVAVNKGWFKKGTRSSPDTEFKKGNIPISPLKKGQRLSPSTEFTTENTSGYKNNKWKGDNVGYTGVHLWVYKTLGKASECSICNGWSKRYVWHNIDMRYKREISNWISVCDKCHKKLHKKRK